MKFLIITMGPGETSHGVAFAHFLAENSHMVTLGVLHEENLGFLKDVKYEKKIFQNSKEIEREISSGSFDAVVLCNSKMFKDQKFQRFAPKPRPFCCSIDSNWLFSQSKDYPWVEWLDKYYVNLPPEVYKLGLKENGGNFSISEGVRSKIKVVGTIPSYKPLDDDTRQKIRIKFGLNSSQKLLFSYFGSGITYRTQFCDKYAKVTNMINRKYGDKVKIINIGNEYNKSWFIPTDHNISSKHFYQFLASSDLVFQHQGLGTLEQAISARIPVIANVIKPERNETVNAHAWEVGPFEKAGLCKMHYYDDPVRDVVKSVEKLMFDQNTRKEMISEQIKHYSVGEKKMFENIDANLRRRNG